MREHTKRPDPLWRQAFHTVVNSKGFPVSCLNPTVIHRTTVEQALLGAELRTVPCGKCQKCYLTWRSSVSGALETELQHAHQVPYFVTLTYAESELPWFEGKPAGAPTEYQQAQYDRLVRAHTNRLYGRYGLTERDELDNPSKRELRTMAHCSDMARIKYEPLYEQLLYDRPAVPTHRKQDLNRLVEAYRYDVQVRHGLRKKPRRLRLLSVAEHGGLYGRPHHHLVVFGLDPLEVGYLIRLWPHGHTHIKPVSTGAIAAYMAKDAFKSSFHKELYLAQGVEPPVIRWPRKPGLGYQVVEPTVQHINNLLARNPMEYELHRWFYGLGTTGYVNGKRYPLRKSLVDAIKAKFPDSVFPETPYTHVFAREKARLDDQVARSQQTGEPLQGAYEEHDPAFQRAKAKALAKATRSMKNWNEKTVTPVNAVHAITARRKEDPLNVVPKLGA